MNNENHWGSRRTYLMVLLCQIIGLPVFVGIANSAITYGSTGYILSYLGSTFILGIPLLYMEFIVSQFTARDCIDVWKIYPCVSHVGYVQVIWQVIVIIYNHLINSFVFHYLLISFESPIPYYTCGHWSKSDCDILDNNYTINEDCIRRSHAPPYCDYLFTTFPEYQYWKYNMLGITDETFHIAWRVCLGSGLTCLIMFLSSFKRKRSVKWVVEFFIIYPISGYILILLGSMLQKGVVEIFQDSLDYDFETFTEKCRVSALMLPNIYTLGIGSGVPFNLASSSSFRAPCYANTVVTVMVSVAVSALAICTTAMISCPYAFTYSIDPEEVLLIPMSLLFEKTPRFLSEYQHTYFWLVLIYSSHAAIGIGTNLILMLHVLDMLGSRSPKVAKYPGLVSFLTITVIYFCTIPLLGEIGISVLIILRETSSLIGVFIAIIETIVFVMWYGLEKFSEDVHFMQGLQPNKFTRLSWLVSSIILTYVFVNETIIKIKTYKGGMYDEIGFYALVLSLSFIVIVFMLKLIVAAYKKEFYDVFKLNRAWGPRSEVLQRSRAMFSAQAMTKEYLYRQYHLQAGILARQKMSNCRTGYV